MTDDGGRPTAWDDLPGSEGRLRQHRVEPMYGFVRRSRVVTRHDDLSGACAVSDEHPGPPPRQGHGFGRAEVKPC